MGFLSGVRGCFPITGQPVYSAYTTVTNRDKILVTFIYIRPWFLEGLLDFILIFFCGTFSISFFAMSKKHLVDVVTDRQLLDLLHIDFLNY